MHDLDGISFGADRPSQWYVLTADERGRSELTSDQCVMESNEGRHFFVRGCLEIPIRGGERTFTWGVWVSLSEENFLEMSEHWEDAARTELGPYFGWLSTALPTYPDTMFLNTTVH